MTVDKSVKNPLVKAVGNAISTIREALAEGTWEVDEARDPLALISDLSDMLHTKPVVLDVGKAVDLAAISLAAMDMGEWTDVTEDQISDIQGLNFLAMLADEMAPNAVEIAIAM
jgi:hypothetical protein